MDMDGNGWIWIVIDGYGWIWMGMDGYGWICMLWIDMDGWMWMDGSSISGNGSNSSSLLTFTPPAP